MNDIGKLMIAVFACLMLQACVDKTTGKACLGTDSDSLVEGLKDQCQAGDTVATKNPAYYCDFNYTVAFNGFNSAFCIYSGAQKPERTSTK